jgi:hypothetical protein
MRRCPAALGVGVGALASGMPCFATAPRVGVSSGGHGAAAFYNLGGPFADGFESGDASTWSATVP